MRAIRKSNNMKPDFIPIIAEAETKLRQNSQLIAQTSPVSSICFRSAEKNPRLGGHKDQAILTRSSSTIKLNEKTAPAFWIMFFSSPIILAQLCFFLRRAMMKLRYFLPIFLFSQVLGDKE
jgi:hypothetical protein